MGQNKQKTQRLISKAGFIILLSLGVAGIIIIFFYRKNRRQKRRASKKATGDPIIKAKVNTAFDEVIQLAKENDPSFLARFREVYPEVHQQLAKLEPSFAKSELEFCTMIWLGFSTKDIARYTHIQPKSVQIKKYRLRKRMNLPKGKYLYEWVKNI